MNMWSLFWAFHFLSIHAAAQIRVLSPRWVVDQFPQTLGKIEGSTATFGAPFYGDSVLGKLVWAESAPGTHHCTEEDYDVPQPEADKFLSSEGNHRQLITILIVRRGECAFTAKVRVAQKKGAHAVIIVDREDSEKTARDMHRIIVGDDGFGEQVSIPSVLISKQEGANLIDATKEMTQVIIEMKWNIPTNHVVEMDMWMSSGSKASQKFLKDFSERRKKLNEVVKFKPHYVVFKMPSSDPSVYNDLCTDNTGEFCTEDPDGAGSVTGKDVLEEDIRQLCIHETTKVKRVTFDNMEAERTTIEYAAKYWEYVEKIVDECPIAGEHPESRFGTVCAERLMAKVLLDVEKVKNCITTTGERKLKDERDNTAWSPRALRINGWRYSGMIDADLVTRAICSGFVSQPEECSDLVADRDPLKKFIQGVGPKQTGVSFGTFMISMSFVVFIAACAFFLYKRIVIKQIHRSVKEEVMLEVQHNMAQYNQMR